MYDPIFKAYMEHSMIKLFITLLAISFMNISFAVDSISLNELSHKEKIEVIWEKYLDERLDAIEFFSVVDELEFQKISKSDQLRIQIIKKRLLNLKSTKKVSIIEKISENEALKLASEWLFIGSMTGVITPSNLALISKAKKYLESLSEFRIKSKKEIQDLFLKTPDYANYNNGEYKDTLKVFLFCRHNRKYPCLIMLKDIFDNPVRNSDGSLWSMPALAHSRRELPYNITNGYTPSGVHMINSVMPEANRQILFGEFRRLILDWVPKAEANSNILHFLPKSAQNKKWWREASVARDVGRKWLRIHGTGNRNTDRSSKFYPHYATSGCVSTREMEYDGVKYVDQRVLLDKMMSSMQLAPIYTSETLLKGILYVIEIDDKQSKVQLEDLELFGLN